MKMQSSVLSKTEVSPMESKLSKITELQQKESVATWTWKHPNIQPSFFESLPAPIDIDDAHLRMCCHKNTEIDFDLQIRTMELEEKEYSNAKNEGRPVDDLIADKSVFLNKLMSEYQNIGCWAKNSTIIQYIDRFRQLR